jgi:hypothetical protein
MSGGIAVRFHVHCNFADVWAVDAAAAHAALIARQWKHPWEQRMRDCAKPLQKAAVQREFRKERDRLIAAGELAFTRQQLLRQALIAHIDRKGWRRREWDPIPPGEDPGPGRRWGTGHQYFETDLYFHCDGSDGELLRRVAYWQSASATTELVKWTHRWGRGPAAVRDMPEGVQGLAMMVTMMKLPRAQDLRTREKLRAQIMTTGDILRQVIAEAGDGYAPPRSSEYRAWLESQKQI